MDFLSIHELYQRFGEPRKIKVERMDGAPCSPEVPSYSVMPAQLAIPSDQVSDPRIIISDFGEAWLSDTETREELQTPVLFLPPETTFSRKLNGKPADVWTLGCTLYEILGERPLFEGFMPDKDDIIAEMVSCLGLLPQHWWQSWQARGDFFLEDGSWKTDMKHFHESKSRPLLLRIHQMGRENDSEFSEDEAKSMEKMVRTMLTYEPTKRATAREIMESDWMTRWGLPALEKLM